MYRGKLVLVGISVLVQELSMTNRLSVFRQVGTISSLVCLVVLSLEQAVTAQENPPGGQPLAGAKPSVPDLEEQVAYHRAFEAMVWAMPASAMHRFREGVLALPGVEDNVILAYSDTLRTKHKAITAKHGDTVHRGGDGPPQGASGGGGARRVGEGQLVRQVVNAGKPPSRGWDRSGRTRGRAAIPAYPSRVQGEDSRRLFPDPEFDLPHCPGLSLRPGEGATAADAYAYTKTLRMYPLADAANPKPTKFVDGIKIGFTRCPTTTSALCRTSTTSSAWNRLSPETR